MTTLIPKFDLKNGGSTPTGAINRTIYEKLSDFISVKDFGAKGDGATDDSAAIQAALDVAGRIHIPSGTYKVTTTLVVKNNTVLFGDGNTTAAGGSIISYTGASDAIQINNPVNSSTAAFITLQDFTVISSTATALKACIADTGSSFLHIERVTVQGNWAGIIFDQTEVSSIKSCNFEAQDIVGLWLVNGNAHNASANQYYTNQISVENCQFNRVALSNTFAIIDDGGAAHEFKNSNFNGWGTWMRLASQTNTKITNNEFEGAADTYPIAFWNVTSYNSQSVAPGTTCTFDANVISNSATQNAIAILGGGNTQNTINLNGNVFTDQTLATVKNANNLGALNLLGNYPNTTKLYDTAPPQLFNYLASDWTPTNGEVTITVNYAKYVKISTQVTVSFDLTWPTTSNASVAYISGLPFALATNSPCSGVIGSSTGANAQFLFADTTAQVIYIKKSANATNTNADISAYTIKGSITYITGQ